MCLRVGIDPAGLRQSPSVEKTPRSHREPTPTTISGLLRHGGKRWGGSGLASDRSNSSRKHVGNSLRSHNAVGWCRSTSSSKGGKFPHPWNWGPFRVVSGVWDGIYRRIPLVSGRTKSISTFSSMVAADRKSGPWCVWWCEPTWLTSGSHPRLHLTGNHLRQLLPVYCRHARKHSGRSETTLQNTSMKPCLWYDTPSMGCSTANMPHGHNGRDGEAENC